jgi:hypothetical protein
MGFQMFMHVIAIEFASALSPMHGRPSGVDNRTESIFDVQILKQGFEQSDFEIGMNH